MPQHLPTSHLHNGGVAHIMGAAQGSPFFPPYAAFAAQSALHQFHLYMTLSMIASLRCVISKWDAERGLRVTSDGHHSSSSQVRKEAVRPLPLAIIHVILFLLAPSPSLRQQLALSPGLPLPLCLSLSSLCCIPCQKLQASLGSPCWAGVYWTLGCCWVSTTSPCDWDLTISSLGWRNQQGKDLPPRRDLCLSPCLFASLISCELGFSSGYHRGSGEAGS